MLVSKITTPDRAHKLLVCSRIRKRAERRKLEEAVNLTPYEPKMLWNYNSIQEAIEARQ